MKTSAKILFSFLLFLSCNSKSANAQTLVGKIDNSGAVLTANKATLLKNYNKNLLEISGINGNFTDITIISEGGSYYLVFKGAAYKSSMLLITQPDAGNSITYLVAPGKVSCTTSDCASEPKGCVPAMEGQSCTPCANGGKCTKTVSSGSLLEE